jgi:hypothetical protein
VTISNPLAMKEILLLCWLLVTTRGLARLQPAQHVFLRKVQSDCPSAHRAIFGWFHSVQVMHDAWMACTSKTATETRIDTYSIQGRKQLFGLGARCNHALYLTLLPPSWCVIHLPPPSRLIVLLLGNEVLPRMLRMCRCFPPCILLFVRVACSSSKHTRCAR